MRKAALVLVGSALSLVLLAGPALACGALVSPNGTISLVRTTTLAAYHDGIEHYITGFEFAGANKDFGSIIPLPGVPSQVIRGGDWTLQRLEREVNPPITEDFAFANAALSRAPAVVLLRKKIDALDVTILKGGGFEVGRWVTRHGFRLTPDAPQVLDFYSRRSPVFMAVKFNAERAAAKGERVGDAIPIHLVIPTQRPWVPLRILGLGSKPAQRIEADVFLLNDAAPTMLPAPKDSFEFGLPPARGLRVVKSEPASRDLLADLRSDRGMRWLPKDDVWLNYLRLNAPAGRLHYDLAIDPTGRERPSFVDAGLTIPISHTTRRAASTWPLWAVALGIVALLGASIGRVTARPAA